MNRNLLIIYEYAWGTDVREIAEATGKFNKIICLEHTACCEHNRLKVPFQCQGLFTYAFPACSDGEKRIRCLEQLQEQSFIIPILIHPETRISSFACIKEGSAVAAGSIIKEYAVLDTCCFLDRRVFVGKGAVIGFGCNVGNSSVVQDGSVLKPFTNIKQSSIYHYRPSSKEYMMAMGY